MMSGKLTMDDLLFQFDQMKKFGSLKKIVERLPGVSGNLKGEDLEKAESRVKVYKPIIQSMTREEKENQERLNASRMRRIAAGSGTTEKDGRGRGTRDTQMEKLMR